LLDIEGVGRAFVWLSTLPLVTSTTLHVVSDRPDRSWRLRHWWTAERRRRYDVTHLRRFNYWMDKHFASSAESSLPYDARPVRMAAPAIRVAGGKPAALATLVLKTLWRRDTELYKLLQTGYPETLEGFDIIIFACIHMCTPHKYACNPTCITSFTPFVYQFHRFPVKLI